MVWKPKTKVIKRPQNTLGGKLVKAKYKVNKDGKLATWRPTKRTPEVIEKLQEAFLYNCTEQEACAYAGIDQSTFIDWKKADEEFAKWVEWAKSQYAYAIKKTSYARATNVRTKDSTEILFRIDKRYKEQDDSNKNTTVTILDIARIMQEKRLSREKGEDPEVIDMDDKHLDSK